jgi:hypothetical protein
MVMIIEMESIGPHIEKVAQDWSQGEIMGMTGLSSSLPPSSGRQKAPGMLLTQRWMCPEALVYSSSLD